MTGKREQLISLALLWMSGTALRLTILAVPPLLLLIRDELHLSATEIGLLSGLPVVMLAVAAVPGSLLIARVGSRTALVAGLLLVAAGGALRGGSWDALSLYVTTVLMGAGVAIMQPALPVLVREWLPTRIGFATAVYSNGLLIGEILPVSLAKPLAPLLGESWRTGLAIWSVPVVIIALLVILFAPKGDNVTAIHSKRRQWQPDWRSPLLWQVAILFGGANATYFASNAFIPAFLGSIGRNDIIPDALTALNLGQLPASLILLTAASRLERRAWPYMAAALFMLTSVVGLVFMAGVWTIIWAACIGCSCASGLVLGLTLPPLLTEKENVGPMSAGMFALSYMMAVAIALISGVAWDLSGIPSFAFIPIGLCAVTMGLSALILRLERKLC
ncbi:MAG TPA: MFS transporter [Hyphomicrobiales bacterium]|nr:MFS transporter [Hyphomicrobiales bacterium]